MRDIEAITIYFRLAEEPERLWHDWSSSPALPSRKAA